MWTHTSVFSYLHTLTTWHCPHSPAAAAVSNRHLLPTNLQQRGCCCGYVLGHTDGQTDRRTDTVPFHRPCSTYIVGSANNAVVHIRLHPWSGAAPWWVSFYPHNAMAMSQYESICPCLCVCLSQASIITSKQLHKSSWFLVWRLPSLYMYCVIKKLGYLQTVANARLWFRHNTSVVATCCELSWTTWTLSVIKCTDTSRIKLTILATVDDVQPTTFDRQRITLSDSW